MFPNRLLVFLTLMVLSITGFSQLDTVDVAAPFIAKAPTLEGDTGPVLTAEAPTVGDNLPPGYTVMLDNTTGEAYLVAENGTRTLAVIAEVGPCGPCCCGWYYRIKPEKGESIEGRVEILSECLINPVCLEACKKSGDGPWGCPTERLGPQL